MTTRPQLNLGEHLVSGAAAIALFLVLAFTFVRSEFDVTPAGFGDGSITASVGYAMFSLTDLAAHPSEPFLVAFEIIDIVLVAALVGAVMLARREDGSMMTAMTDGGEDPEPTDGTDDGGED
jgi:NADH-quinone oxidoreductase subunit J